MAERRPTAPPPPVTQPVPKAPFLPSDLIHIRRVGQVGDDGLTVYTFADVAEELIFTSTFRPALTAAGILTGGYFRGPAGDYVELRGFCNHVVLESTMEFTEHLFRDWARIFGDPDLEHAGLRPVGWFLSRPGSHGELGPFELLVHLSYFNLPFHIAWILDPIARVGGMYRRGDGDRMRNIGYNVIEVTEPQSVGREDGDGLEQGDGDSSAQST